MTQEEFDSLYNRILQGLLANSKMATDLRVVKSPAGVNLLPGMLSGELVALEAASLMGTDGKTPLFEIGSTSSGSEADASIVLSGTDPAGNPIYKIGLVMPKGDDGAIPFLEFGGISTSEPDTDATASFKENGITEDGRPKYKLSLTIPRGSKGDKGNDGKTPVLEAGSASKGQEPDVSVVPNGDDPTGNPKYKIDLVLPQGDAGKNPVLEFSEIMTGAAGSEASAVFTPVGQTPEGNPKYSLKLTIPRGDPGLPGTGSGNVSVNGSNLVRGKQYLFIPSSDGSTEGSFVEYIPFDDTQLRTEIANNLEAAKTYTNEQIAGIIQFDIQVVSALPEMGQKGVIYLVPKTRTVTDAHDEYIWIADQDKYEFIGSTAVDLSNYYTKDEANNRYVLKEVGKRLMTDEEGAKLQGVEDGANKYVLPAGEGFNFIPVGGNIGQVLANSAPGVAEWADSVGGGIFIGDVQMKSINATTDPDTFAEFINGYTMADFDNAVINQTPVYSVLKNLSGVNYGYARAVSVVKELDGTSVAYVMVFELSTRVSFGRTGVEYLSLYLQGVQDQGWRYATIRGTQIGGNYTPSSGHEIIFTGGYYEIGLYTEAPPVFTIVSPWWFPMQNSTTTLLIKNSAATENTFTMALGASASVDGSKLLFAGELPSIPGYHAVEVSILWANWRYTVRFSEPFDYRNYIE